MANNNGDNEPQKIPSLAEMLNLLAGGAPLPSSKPAEVEPSADLRQAALAMRQMHNAFVWAGWSEDQATQLTIAIFTKSNTEQ